MSNINIAYSSGVPITITLTGLPSNGVGYLTTGQTSVSIFNTGTNLYYLDAFVGGKITVGTSPTDQRQIEIWAYGNIDDVPTYPDVIVGTDAQIIISTMGTKISSLKLLSVIGTGPTTSQTYWFGPVSVASVFGGILPKNWGLFVCQNTAVTLNTTGTQHSITYTPIYETVI